MTQQALDEYRRRWAHAIRTHRREVLRVGQVELAALLRVGQSTVATWEKGRGVPNDLMKIRVIALLGLDARELFRPLEADPIERLVP